VESNSRKRETLLSQKLELGGVEGRGVVGGAEGSGTVVVAEVAMSEILHKLESAASFLSARPYTSRKIHRTY
jgi:hypothetical protein